MIGQPSVQFTQAFMNGMGFGRKRMPASDGTEFCGEDEYTGCRITADHVHGENCDKNCVICMGGCSPDSPDHERPVDDPVNHPPHYASIFRGLEVIDLTEQMNFNRGNAVKYICRAGHKDPGKEVEDLQKAAWYINREIERLRST